MKYKRIKAFTGIEFAIIAIIIVICGYFVHQLYFRHHCGNECSAIGTLRTFMSAQAIYKHRHSVYGDFQQLHSDELIDNSTASGKRSGYFYGQITPSGVTYFTACAMPIDDGKSGEKEFCVTESNVVYEAIFNSSGKILNFSGGDVDWSNPAFNIPPEFVVDPLSLPAIWKPAKH